MQNFDQLTGVVCYLPPLSVMSELALHADHNHQICCVHPSFLCVISRRTLTLLMQFVHVQVEYCVQANHGQYDGQDCLCCLDTAYEGFGRQGCTNSGLEYELVCQAARCACIPEQQLFAKLTRPELLPSDPTSLFTTANESVCRYLEAIQG